MYCNALCTYWRALFMQNTAHTPNYACWSWRAEDTFQAFQFQGPLRAVWRTYKQGVLCIFLRVKLYFFETKIFFNKEKKVEKFNNKLFKGNFKNIVARRVIILEGSKVETSFTENTDSLEFPLWILQNCDRKWGRECNSLNARTGF